MNFIDLIKEWKKEIIGLLLIILVASVIGVIYMFKANKGNDIKFANEEEKRKYIEEFAKGGGAYDENPPSEKIDKNSGGYDGITEIENIDTLKDISFDFFIVNKEKIIGGLNYINSILKDRETILKDKKKYFVNNKEILSAIYGITNENEFNNFINKLIDAKEGKIVGGKINKNTIKVNGNNIEYTLIAENEVQSQISYNIKVARNINKIDFLLMWR